MTASELAEEMRRLSELLDQALAYLKATSRDWAVKEDTYRMTKAKAFLNGDATTVSDREAQSILATSTERQEAHEAEAMMKAALEAVRSRRAQLSAVQTLMNVVKSEMDMNTYGQNQETP
jgi:hypothetical protein